MGSSEVGSGTDFSSFKYAELQKIAKSVGIKANVAQKKLVAALFKYYDAKKDEDQQTEVPKKEESAAGGTPSSNKQAGKVEKKTVHTPVLEKRNNTLKQTPVGSPSLNARKQTIVQSPAVMRQSEQTKQTPVGTPVTNSRKQTKTTPVHSPAVKSRPGSLTRTPVSSPVVKCKTRPGSKTPTSSPAVRQASKQPPTKSAPQNKKLSGSGKRKASETLSETPVGSPPTKKRRSTFEIPSTVASPAPQSEAGMEPRSPQAKELIEAMRPEMSNEEMKNSLMSAIDRKVQAKCLTESASKPSSNIPRFAAFLAKKKESKPATPGTGKKPITPGNKDWSKIHKKNFEKFDSLDVYLDKKKKRAEEITASVKKAKNILAEVQASVNKLKSHKTTTTENVVKRPRRSSDSKKSVPFKPSAINLSEANFNFGAMKSPKTQPRKSGKGVVVASGKKIAATPMNNGIGRKSTGIGSTQKPTTTPFRFTATLNTTLNTTQSTKKNVFDLQASLAKPLTWVPHKGKLKPFGAEDKKSPVKKPAIGQSIHKARNVMVLMESLAGTGHKLIRIRPKTDDKLEFLFKDPWVNQVVLYRERKKIRTLSTNKRK